MKQGPASSEAPFSPTDIESIHVFQATAAATGLSDSDVVTTWSNAGGSGLNASGSGSTRPIIKLNILNGFPVVRFTPQQYLNMSSGALTGVNTPISYIAVVRYNTLAANTFSTIGTIGAATDRYMGCYYTTNASYAQLAVAGMGPATMTPVRVASPTLAIANNWRLIEWYYNGGGNYETVSNWEGFIDGNAQTLSAATAGSGTATADNRIGSWGNNQLGFNGDMADWFVYPTSLDSTQRSNIRKYVAARYGLTIAA